MSDAFVSVNGLRLHYVEWGPPQSIPIILLHGSRGHAHVWDAFASAVAAEYRVLALDQRGHGESDWASSYRAEDYASDLESFVEALRLPPFVLIGHSMGSLHGMIYAGRHPGRLQGLVLIDIEACPPPQQKQHLNGQGSRPARVFDSLEDAYKLEQGTAPEAPAELMRLVTEHNLRPLEDGRLIQKYDQATLRDFEQYDCRACLPRISCPTLILRGTESIVMRDEVAREMQRAIPGCRYQQIEGATHLVFLSRPREFERAVRQFLTSLPGGGGRGVT